MSGVALLKGQRVTSPAGKGEVIGILGDKVIVKLDNGATATFAQMRQEMIAMQDSRHTNGQLERFLEAQEKSYEQALAELERGKKRSHWIWFIFPQIAGLGTSATSQFYAIRDMKEAEEYLLHPVLGLRLTTCCKALLRQETDDAQGILGSPDDLKLKSCMTLFDAVPATFPVFGQVLDKFYGGEKDERT